MVLKRIGVLSLARLLGVLYGVLGLVIGFGVSLFSLVGAMAGLATEGGEAALVATAFGVGAFLVFPVMYALLGFVGGALTAALYNLGARIVGGLELEFEVEPSPRG